MFPLPIRPSLYHRWGCLSRGTLCRCSMVFHRVGGECYLSLYMYYYIYYISYIFKHTLPPTDHPSYPYHGVYRGTSPKPMNLKALCPKNAQNSPKHCRKFAGNSQEFYLIHPFPSFYSLPASPIIKDREGKLNRARPIERRPF